MRFTAVLLGALATLAVAQSSSSSSGTATTAVQNTQTAADPAQSSAYEKVLKCIAACNPGDVNCQAKCSGNPFPNDAQVNATTECVAACPKGDGKDVAADTAAFAACRDKCIADHYLTNSAAPQATGTSGSGSGSGSGGSGNSGSQTTGGAGGAQTTGGSNSGSGSNTSGSGSSGGSQTSSGAATKPTNAAGSVRVGGAAVAAAGFLAAVAAL